MLFSLGTNSDSSWFVCLFFYVFDLWSVNLNLGSQIKRDLSQFLILRGIIIVNKFKTRRLTGGPACPGFPGDP